MIACICGGAGEVILGFTLPALVGLACGLLRKLGIL